MYEAVGLFFPFVRYAAFMLVIRSLLAERSSLLQKCVAIFGGRCAARSFHPVRVSCQDTILPVESHGGPCLWAARGIFPLIGFTSQDQQGPVLT